jgi:hypothetical protein
LKNKFLKIILPMLLLVIAIFIIGPGCSPTPTPPPIVEKPIVVDTTTGNPFPESIDKECVGNYITNGYFNTTVKSPNIQDDEDIIAATG